MKRFFTALLKALCYVLLFVLAQTAVTFAATFIFGIQYGLELAMSGVEFDVGGMEQGLMQFVQMNVGLISIVSSALTLFLLWPVFAVSKKKYARAITLTRPEPPLSVLGAAVFGFSFAIALSVVLDLLPIPESVWEQYEQFAVGLSNENFLTILAVVIAAPVVEEVIFRALVYTRLKRGMPMLLAVLLESAAFAVLHGALIWMAYAFVLGVIITLIYEKFGSVWVPIAFHIAFNFAGSLVVTRIGGETDMLYWIALAIGAAVSVAMAVWLASMPKRGNEVVE